MSTKDELMFLLLCYNDEDLMFLLGKKAIFLADDNLTKGLRWLLFDYINHINFASRNIRPRSKWIEATLSNFGLSQNSF